MSDDRSLDYDDVELLTPRRKRALAWAAGVALVLATAVVGLRLYGQARLAEMRREAARQGPLDPAAYAPPVAPDGENAARAFLAAAAGIVTPTADLDTLSEARVRRPAAWSAEDRAAVERYLAANGEARLALRQAATLAGGGLGLDYALDDPLAGRPPWRLVDAMRLLEIDGHAAAAAGDLDAAVAAADGLGRLATLLHAEPEVMLQVFAIVAGGGQLRVAREIVAAAPPPDALRRLRASVDGLAERPALARAFRRQTAALLAGDVDARARRLGRRAGQPWHAASWLAGEILVAEGLRGQNALARIDELPYLELAAAVDAAAPRLPLGPFGEASVELQATALRADAVAAARQLARLALALAAAGDRDGRHPAALPDHPAATTPDPLTASLPSYRVEADGSARLWLDQAESKSGSAVSLASMPFSWELPAPRPRG